MARKKRKKPEIHESREYEYEVEFLILRRVKVRAFDELQAEKTAYAMLQSLDQNSILKYRVHDENGPMFDFSTPDLEWMSDKPS